MNRKVLFYGNVAYAVIFFCLSVLVNVIDYGIFKAGGGGASLILLVGSLLALLFEGEAGKIVFTLITFVAGCCYLFKAKNCRKKLD